MTRRTDIDRRSFLLSVTAAGGALALGFDIPFGATRARAQGDAPEVTAWIVIEPDDTVTIRVAKSEMGQGSFTALPMLVAEELACDWSKVKPEFAPPGLTFQKFLDTLQGLTDKKLGPGAASSGTNGKKHTATATSAYSRLTTIRPWRAVRGSTWSTVVRRASRPRISCTSVPPDFVLPATGRSWEGAANGLSTVRRAELIIMTQVGR